MMCSEVDYRQDLQQFLQDTVCMYVEDWEKNKIFPREILLKLGQKGFFTSCFTLPPSVNDKESHLLTLTPRIFSILIEELAKTQCFGLTLAVSIHVGVFLPLVLRLANQKIQQQIVQPALQGELLGAIAATEANVAGSDFMGMETIANFTENRIILQGQKNYIANAIEADYVVVFARHRAGRNFANFCALLVPTNLVGIKQERIPMAVMRTAAISKIEFQQVELDQLLLLGRKGLGFQYFLQHIAVERLSGGVWAAAVADKCLKETINYTQQHIIGTESLWNRSSIRHQIAQAAVKVTLLQALAEKIIHEMEKTGNVNLLQSSVLKAFVAPAIEEIINTCLQLQGARGLKENSPLLRLLNDFRVFGIAGGSTETMLDVIAESYAEKAVKETV